MHEVGRRRLDQVERRRTADQLTPDHHLHEVRLAGRQHVLQPHERQEVSKEVSELGVVQLLEALRLRRLFGRLIRRHVREDVGHG